MDRDCTALVRERCRRLALLVVLVSPLSLSSPSSRLRMIRSKSGSVSTED